MNRIIYILLAVCFITSCETDNTVPFLSIPKEEAQIIEMYVGIDDAANLKFMPIVHASQMIVSWGDGSRAVEYINPDSVNTATSVLKPLSYTYSSTNNYTVNIRAVKITKLELSKDSVQQDIYDLKLTDCRHLKTLSSFNQKTLRDMAINTSGIKILNLSKTLGIENLSVMACDSLSTIELNQNPLLKSIKLTDNKLFTATSLNYLFSKLPQVNDSRTIVLSNNEGDAACDTSIATKKGWKVTIE